MTAGPRPSVEGRSVHVNRCTSALVLVWGGGDTSRTGEALGALHLSREEPWRTGSARDIPPLTGDEVRVRTGRRMFGGKRVVQAAGEPVIGQRSCCVKLIESQQLEAVFLFRYSSINYRGYICFLMYRFIHFGPFLVLYNSFRCYILEL